MLKSKNKCVNTIIIITSSQVLEHKHHNSYGMTFQKPPFTVHSYYKMFMMASLFVL